MTLADELRQRAEQAQQRQEETSLNRDNQTQEAKAKYNEAVITSARTIAETETLALAIQLLWDDTDKAQTEITLSMFRLLGNDFKEKLLVQEAWNRADTELADLDDRQRKEVEAPSFYKFLAKQVITETAKLLEDEKFGFTLVKANIDRRDWYTDIDGITVQL